MMEKKKDEKYFSSLVEEAKTAREAAAFLQDVVANYDPDKLEEQMKQMHEIEHAGDRIRHEMVKKLSVEFITPIEREDIMNMSYEVDTVTDKIEDVLLRLYMFNIRKLRPEITAGVDLIVRCVEALELALAELHNFKRSDKLQPLLIRVNELEDEADEFYVNAVHSIFTDDSVSAKEAIGWNQVLYYIEGVCDACEDVADLIEGVVLKNT
jgi:predicted phosphate transport protein (TIGR00153 family)